MLRNYRIGVRLNVSYAAILTLVILLLGLALYSLWTINSHVKGIVERGASVQLANDVRDGAQKVNSTVMSMILINDQKVRAERKDQLAAAKQACDTAIAKLEKTSQTKEMKAQLQKMREALVATNKSNDEAIKLMESDLYDLALSTFIGNSASMSAIMEICDEIVRSQQKENIFYHDLIKSSFTRVTGLIVAMGLATIVLAMVIAVVLKKSIVKPLKTGVEAANSLAAGDLSARPSIDGKDEISLLLGALDNTSVVFREILGNMRDSSDRLASASIQLSSGSEELSRSAANQAGLSSQVAAASEEMAQTVLDVAKNSATIATSAEKTAHIAKDGKELVERTVKEMGKVAEAAEESTKTVTLLGERSQEIGRIVGVISDIADQTNLLALNAAIEAARAGEHGRGFAVVANEVRNLAEQTTTATREIEQTINSIRSEVNKAIDAMHQTAGRIESGAELSQKSGVALGNIVDAVEELLSMVHQIASATEQMSATSDEMAQDIERIAASSKAGSTTAEQTASASVDLSKLAATLQQIVGRFRI